jgi:hypothetical protein
VNTTHRLLQVNHSTDLSTRIVNLLAASGVPYTIQDADTHLWFPVERLVKTIAFRVKDGGFVLAALCGAVLDAGVLSWPTIYCGTGPGGSHAGDRTAGVGVRCWRSGCCIGEVLLYMKVFPKVCYVEHKTCVDTSKPL